ncbi:MAG: PD-(D/E)XK nuclease domain-containing protein [Eisenbergiella sp.]
MEELIAGGNIEKPVHEDITYDEVYKTEDNLWNFLYFTGYLKKLSERFDGETVYLTLAIPNTEVKLIYRNTILDWFNQSIKKKDFSALYGGILQKKTDVVEREISKNLMETISFYDYKEDYYHGFLAGLLKMMDGYTLKSNRESGLGRSDLLLLSSPYEGVAVIIELKAADSFAQLEDSAREALCQIREKRYDAELKLEGTAHFFIMAYPFSETIGF